MVVLFMTLEEIAQSVRVLVKSEYIPSQSDPENHVYFFAYHVRIANEGVSPVQLLSRHWIITNANGTTQEVQGPGVVGLTPVIKPGEIFTYSSFCPLDTPVGSMYGTYQMTTQDALRFDALIPAFTLSVPGSLN